PRAGYRVVTEGTARSSKPCLLFRLLRITALERLAREIHAQLKLGAPNNGRSKSRDLRQSESLTIVISKNRVRLNSLTTPVSSLRKRHLARSQNRKELTAR
ncbi:MAG TPA: hypothetical protein PLP59_13205, partial [Thermotogota bacterium]|nr:hypothetical protein [Thermotogota bacterium]